MEQDSALVKRAQSGDTAAFGELYSLYWQQLYRFALYNLSNSEDAKDAVQDAVLAVYRNIGNIRDKIILRHTFSVQLQTTAKAFTAAENVRICSR